MFVYFTFLFVSLVVILVYLFVSLICIFIICLCVSLVCFFWFICWFDVFFGFVSCVFLFSFVSLFVVSSLLLFNFFLFSIIFKCNKYRQTKSAEM